MNEDTNETVKILDETQHTVSVNSIRMYLEAVSVALSNIATDIDNQLRTLQAEVTKKENELNENTNS